MRDPKRLADADDLGASLLRAARTHDAERARERKAAWLGVAAAGTTIAAAKVLPKAAWQIALGKWTLLGVVVGVTAGAAAQSRRSDPPARARPIAALVQERTKRVEARIAAPIPAPIPAPADLEIDLDLPVGEGARGPAPARVPRGAPKPTIADEAASLRVARAALAANDAARALAALDAHDQRFPEGALRIEAEMVRIEALARSGDTTAAARGRRFVKEHPDTPYAPRARALAADGGGIE